MTVASASPSDVAAAAAAAAGAGGPLPFALLYAKRARLRRVERRGGTVVVGLASKNLDVSLATREALILANMRRQMLGHGNLSRVRKRRGMAVVERE